MLAKSVSMLGASPETKLPELRPSTPKSAKAGGRKVDLDLTKENVDPNILASPESPSTQQPTERIHRHKYRHTHRIALCEEDSQG